MAIEALTLTDAGVEVLPETAERWDAWISATATRNFALRDPILDWLDRYGEAKGFKRDPDYPDYDPRTDFTEFVFAQGRRFEEAVVRHLESLTPIVAIGGERGDARDLAKAEATFAAMRAGKPVIWQAVLRDAEHRTYGLPDLLIRSDVLAKLFPTALSPEEAAIPAPDLSKASWHYRVVDIKFRTLELNAAGELDNSGSAPAYKLQLYVYNQALGRLQGYEPPESYLLGRSWGKGSGNTKQRGNTCMDRLAPVPQHGTVANKVPIGHVFDQAAAWVRRVRTEGKDWTVIPEPSMPELYPDFGNQQDGPWHHAKQEIAAELEDLTLLWQVRSNGRAAAHAQGVRRWTDPRCTPEVVGLIGKRAATLQAILDVNRHPDSPPVQPARIQTAEKEWRAPNAVEFYVDFETVNDLADDFSRIPERGGQPLIFMIGCGHVEDGQWRFASFVVDQLTETEEARIIDEWLAHMAEVRVRLAPEGPTPLVVHWSPAEVSNFESAYNSAVERHPQKMWPMPRWFDFLGRVMREEPVVVRGTLAFGLKPVAQALHQLGLIETLWEDGPTDGLGAMVGAWWCEQQAREKGCSLGGLDLMQKIVRYNEVDCRVMMETIWHLRQHC